VLIALAATAVLGVAAAHGGAGTAFNAPVKVTPDLGFGYEPDGLSGLGVGPLVVHGQRVY